MESLPSPKQEEIILPLNLHIEDNCAFKSHTEDVVSKFNIGDTTDQLVIEGLKVGSIHHALSDPIAEYMEVLLSSNFQTCTLYKDQIHH